MSRKACILAVAVTVWFALSLARLCASPAQRTSPSPNVKRLVTLDTCTRVLEGDLIEGKRVGQIRLIGVICPAQGEPGFQESLEFTRKLVSGQPLEIEICSERPNDYRDRIRAVVYLPDKTNLNIRILRAGLGRLLEHQPCHVDFAAWRAAETEARNAKRGLWSTTPARRGGAPRSPKPTAQRPSSSGAKVRIRPRH